MVAPRRFGLPGLFPPLRPLLVRHGVRLDFERLAEPHRSIRAALTDPRSLAMRASGISSAARDLAHTLDHLERWLAAQASPRRRTSPATR